MAAVVKPQTSQFPPGMKRNDPETLEMEMAREKGGVGAAWIHLVTDLAENTGMHGLGNVRRHRSIVKKLFWTVVLLSSLGFAVWQITLCVQKLLSLPTETTIKEDFSAKRNFPAVSFCNMNPMLYSQVATLGEFTDYQTGPEESGPLNFTDRDNEEEFMEDTSYAEEGNFLYTYASMSASDRQSVGHQLESMLMSCSYNGQYCATSNFSTFLNSQYGNCYTFNNGYNGTALKSMSKSGPRHALQIELFIEQSEYVKAAAQSAGLRVIIHAADHMPFPEDEGFSVRPGTETYVAIKEIENHLTYPPYGPCLQITEEENLERNAYANFDEGRPSAYSAKVCKITCLQRATMSNCDCYDPAYPHTGPAFTSLGGNFSLCNINDIDVEWCTWEVSENYTAGALNCDCPPACSDQETLMWFYHIDRIPFAVSYDKDISQALWPSEILESDVLENMYYLSESLYKTNSALTVEEQTAFLKKNVLKLRVFFKTLDKTIITTSPSYLVFQFLSDLGGQTGLWLAFSVMTFFEFVELFFDIIVLCISSGKILLQKNRVQRM